MRLDAHIQGLLVCCSNSMNARIHSFSDDRSKAFRNFVNLMRQRTNGTRKCWIYFPFNEREYVIGAWIWELRICDGPAPSSVLVVSPTFASPSYCFNNSPTSCKPLEEESLHLALNSHPAFSSSSTIVLWCRLAMVPFRAFSIMD